MVAATLLVWVLVVQGTLLAGTLGLFFGHGLWLWWCNTRDQPRLARARAMLAAALEASSLPREHREWLQSLPVRLQTRLFADMAPSLSGAQRQQLTVLAQEIGLMTRAEAYCRSRRWWRRLQGAQQLTLLRGGAEAVLPLFRDRQAVVRAQAAEWAADHPSPAVIDALLALLDEPHSLYRFTAQDTLLRLGGLVREPLTRSLALLSGSRLEAALVVAAGLAEPHLLAPALHLCRDESPRVRTLATTLLGTLGGSEAVVLLLERLADTAPEVRAAAAHALRKLGHWPAAPALAPLLRDRAWTVRRAAGLALRALGAPGVLFLRRYLADEDHYAADMARQVIDLPDTAGFGVSP